MGKGQVTVFVIIGVVLLALFGLLIYKGYYSQKKELTNTNVLKLENEASQARFYLQQCVYNNLLNGVFISGLQGGYTNPETAISSKEIIWERQGILKIAQVYYDGKDTFPTLEDIEKDLQEYLRNSNCTEEVKSLPSIVNINLEIPQKYEVIVNVSLDDRKVDVYYLNPITLKFEDERRKIGPIRVELNIPYGLAYKIGKTVLETAKKNPAAAYNIETDCANHANDGYTTVYAIQNRQIIVNDYRSFFDPVLKQSFTFQYLFKGLKIYGGCTG